MKVMLINGSPHERGCTDTALRPRCAAAADIEQRRAAGGADDAARTPG